MSSGTLLAGLPGRLAALPANDPLAPRRARAALVAEIGRSLAGAGRDAALTFGRPCPACGSSAPSRHAVVRAPVFDFHKCGVCTLVYTPRLIRDDVIRARFRETTLARTRFRQLRAESETVDPESYAAILDRVLDHTPSRAAAIDVGCGFGTLAAALLPRFDETLGLELDPRVAEVAARRHGVAVKTVRLEELVRPDSSVDVVTLNGVLEEVADLDSLFVAARRILRPGGVIYAGTTHGASIGLGVLGGRHPAVATHARVNLFTTRALGLVARRHGFVVRSLGTRDDVDLSIADWALAALPGAAALGLTLDRFARSLASRWRLPSRHARGATLELIATRA